MASKDQEFYVPLSAYPRCRFFQQRIKCFCERAAPILGNEMRQRTLRDPLLNCSRVKIIEHGNAKSKIHRKHFYAKKDKAEAATDGEFVQIHVLTTNISYEKLNQDLRKELNNTKALDAIMLKIEHDSETEQSKTHEELVTMVKQSCPDIGSELQIAITVNNKLQTTEHLPASVISTLDVDSIPMALPQTTRVTRRESRKLASSRNILQKEALSTKPATQEDNVDSISHSENLPMETEQSVHVQSVAQRLRSKSATRSPTKHLRPTSGDSISSPVVSRPKSLRFSPPESDSESSLSVGEDSDVPSSPEKHGHRFHRHYEHHDGRQQQQQEQQLQQQHEQQQQKQLQQQRLNQQQYQQIGCEPIAAEETNDSTDIQISKHNLGQAISYCIETKLFDLLFDVEKELEEVKSREDSTKDITDVDKLLYEVNGIYKQGITERCKERNKKNKRTPIPTSLMNAVLDIPKVIGFGRIYGRLSVHVQRKEVTDEELSGLRENIMKCLSGYNMAGEEVKIQLMVKKGSWCCITS